MPGKGLVVITISLCTQVRQPIRGPIIVTTLTPVAYRLNSPTTKRDNGIVGQRAFKRNKLQVVMLISDT